MSLLNQAVGRVAGAQLGTGEATGLVLQRNYMAYRSQWWIFVSGFLEPVFYLFSIGIGVGQLVTGFEFHGETIPYAEFVAPGMLAAAAMNGAMLDSTFNFFFKLKYNKLFDQMLATPADHHRRRARRAELVPPAWRHLLRGVPRRDGGDGPRALLVGGARPAGRPLDRPGLRWCLHGADDLHAHAGRTSNTSPSARCRCSCSRRPSSR